jgi:hypothetical protein
MAKEFPRYWRIAAGKPLPRLPESPGERQIER